VCWHVLLSFLRLDLLGNLLDSLNVLLDILLQILSDGGGTAFLGGFVHGDTGELCDTDEGEEEVDSGEARETPEMSVTFPTKYSFLPPSCSFFFFFCPSSLREFFCLQHVLGLDDEAPAGPDDTRAGEGEVLGKGELLGGTGEVGDTGEDKSPLLFC
jgi:hypothetical protein